MRIHFELNRQLHPPPLLLHCLLFIFILIPFLLSSLHSLLLLFPHFIRLRLLLLLAAVLLLLLPYSFLSPLFFPLLPLHDLLHFLALQQRNRLDEADHLERDCGGTADESETCPSERENRSIDGKRRRATLSIPCTPSFSVEGKRGRGR
ncbi:hypothetical protein PMAYCL1PPCAC_05754 [Pristionchus mayeri]|uniref:Transmembrane protein n=1 Tax=Pristionchus mayeri TaxID=1317129 RepID=A0AAN4Z8Z1_9BILA|nr:hypothetical protein PMAYCL1PPCAC_05754 [Pristionchus mayeri]